MTTILNGLCQGALLVAMLCLLLKIVPRLNAATRYAVWWAVLFGVLILLLRPMGTESYPHRNRPFSDPVLTPGLLHLSSTKQQTVVLQREAPSSSSMGTVSIPNSPDPSPLFPIHIAKKPISLVIFSLWGFTSLLLLVRLIIGFFSLQQLKRNASPAARALQTRLIHLRAEAGISRKVNLLVSNHVVTPMALGLFDPVILIPQSLPEHMSDSDFDHITLHELAHLRRYDDWMNLLQELLLALFPVQPAIFWINRQLTLERESACDDWVIAFTAAPKPYAASLTRIAEFTLWARCGVLASGAAGNPSQLYRRIQRLLDRRRNIAPGISTISLALSVAAIGILTWLTLSAPQVIALADSPPVLAASALGSSLLDSGSTTQPSEPGTQIKSFPVQPGDKLFVNADRGNIHVTAANQLTAGIVVTQRGPNLAEFLKHHQISITQHGHELHIDATSDSSTLASASDVQIEYQIAVPATFDATLKTGAGDIDLRSIHGNLDVDTGAGNIHLQECDGILHAKTGVGNIDFLELGGVMDGRTGSGNITATSGKGNLLVNTGAGNIDINKINGSVIGLTGSGNINAGDCGGALRITAGEGNIDISRFDGPSLNVRTGSGNLSAEIRTSLKADSSLITSIGNIDLTLNSTVAVNLSTTTGMGNVSSEFPQGPINGGGPALALTSHIGNIHVSKK